MTDSGWDHSVGLNYIKSPQQTLVEKYLSNSHRDIKNMTIDELEEGTSVLAEYNTFLRKVIGGLMSDIGILEEKINYMLSVDSVDYKNIYSIVERHSLALSRNEDAILLKKELEKNKAKLAKIKDIPYGVDSILKNMQKIYDRKVQYELRCSK